MVGHVGGEEAQLQVVQGVPEDDCQQDWQEVAPYCCSKSGWERRSRHVLASWSGRRISALASAVVVTSTWSGRNDCEENYTQVLRGKREVV